MNDGVTREVSIEHLKPIQQKLPQLESDRGYIDEVLERGAERAREKTRQHNDETEKAHRTILTVKFEI